MIFSLFIMHTGAVWNSGVEHVLLPAIDRVLRRTGFDAKSSTRKAVLMAALGLDPATKHVFTVPDGLYSGPGVANVHGNDTGMSTVPEVQS